MNLFARFITAVALFLATSVSFAQSAQSPTNAFRPTNGLWLADAKPNHGWTIESSPSGFMFVTVFTYNTDGSPNFLTLQGQYIETPGDPSGNVGRLESPVFRTAGGAPIDSLAPGNATATPIGNAVITFQSGRRATWQMGANTFRLTALQDYPGIDGGYKLPEYFVGRWMLTRHYRRDDTAQPAGVEGYETYFVQLTDGGIVDGKRVLNAFCIDQCLVQTNGMIYIDTPPACFNRLYRNSSMQRIAALRITYDPVTGQLRSESRDPTLFKDLNNELLIVSQNDVQARAYRRPDGTLSDGSPYPAPRALFGFRMVRLPSNFLFNPLPGPPPPPPPPGTPQCAP